MKKNRHLKWMGVGLLLFLFGNTGFTKIVSEGSSQKKLTEVLTEISERYQVVITYDAAMLEDIKVDIEEGDLTGNFEQDFSMILDQTNLDYKYLGTKYYVIYKDTKAGKRTMRKLKRKINQIQTIESSGKISLGRTQRQPRENAVQMLQSLEYLIQGIEVSGTVTDVDSEPLIGVNIQVKGTDMGTSTDIDGRYALQNVEEESVLVFSYVGYQRQEVAVDGRTNINIQMISNAQYLDEVVVVGYGTQKKVNLTGAVSSISSEMLENKPLPDVGEVLRGVSPNLNINLGAYGAEPGSALKFNIRGMGTISGNSAPLILVDGVEMDINNLDPGAIESVSVLKDASSSAIYGSRAPFGVILITTKKGKKNEGVKIQYNNNMIVGKSLGIPHMENSLIFATVYNQAAVNAGSPPQYPEEQMQRIKGFIDVTTQPHIK